MERIKVPITEIDDDNYMKNHNPMARTGGPKEALDILGGIWCNQNFRNGKFAFKENMGYVAYNNIVDRFRWLNGCITEHVRFYLSFLFSLSLISFSFLFHRSAQLQLPVVFVRLQDSQVLTRN